MANHNQHGGRNVALPTENQPTWSPQERAQALTHRGRDNDDHDYRSWRDRSYRDDDRAANELDPRRWEGGRGSELGYVDYGQRSSGRHVEERSHDASPRGERYPAPGSFEGRHHDPGGVDRFGGGGRAAYERMGSQAGVSHRAEPMSYRSGTYGRGYGSYGSPQHATHEAHEAHEDRLPRAPAAQPHVHYGTGPHRGKGPLGYRRSDERIRELICEALADDDQLDASQIQVAVYDGEVTLSGIVEDRQAKRDAEDCTCSIAGVRDVQNLLRVAGDLPSARTSPVGPPVEPSEESDESFPQDKYRA